MAPKRHPSSDSWVGREGHHDGVDALWYADGLYSAGVTACGSPILSSAIQGVEVDANTTGQLRLNGGGRTDLSPADRAQECNIASACWDFDPARAQSHFGHDSKMISTMVRGCPRTRFRLALVLPSPAPPQPSLSLARPCVDGVWSRVFRHKHRQRLLLIFLREQSLIQTVFQAHFPSQYHGLLLLS